jgi:outer membrane protein insertion porin family
LTHSRLTSLVATAAIAVGAGGCAGLWQCPTGTWGQAAQTSPVPSTKAAGKNQATEPLIVRGQSPPSSPPAAYPSGTLPGGYFRGPQPVSGGTPPTTTYAPGPYTTPPAYSPAPPVAAPPPQQPNYAFQPQAGPPPTGLPAPPADAMPGISGGISPVVPSYPGFQPPTNFPEIPATPTPLDVFVEETRTGQFMFGVTVNSNAGLLGNIVISERNFDILNPPTSWDDFAVGRAWRGGGQGFRLEAQPGTVLQRYLVSFTEPYFLNTPISFDASGYYYNRIYFDWTEARVGGRLALGRRLTPDLSLAGALRMEDVDIFNLRVHGVPELDAVQGHNDIFSGRVTLSHDTRDIPFMPTQGHLISGSFEQAFGEFSFPRGDFELAQYLMVRQRPDGSGRHTAAFITKLGVSGSDTPIFENYFAGGYSTIRGFQFRGASPKDQGVTIGGRFQWLNSAEYYFPLTADDMIRGTVFCDFGTVERNVALHPDQFRVAPGFGFRINVPAMGPAPLAFDFAFPVASAATDHRQLFSFFFGASR